MASSNSQSPPNRPLYSPRNPVLRALIVVLVAGFVIGYEAIAALFNTGGDTVSLTTHESANSFSQHLIS